MDDAATVHGMQRYYAQRAAEYERIYDKPERQADLAAIKAWLPPLFAGRDVLEVACGTGYWTPHAAAASASWTATDVNDEVLAIARTKPLPPDRVRFEIADAYALQGPRRFDAAFAGFWWSHVLREQASAWIDRLHGTLLPGARVVFLDNRYVEGSSQPVTRRDAAGNSYQSRRLDDGSTHEVLKNFPTAGELHHLLGDRAGDVAWTEWPYFWACTYTVT
jgi:demethylmenaquinone methyltransferase/2-methoxy-6-polyprenyl-1,4-benzoquinol methylase